MARTGRPRRWKTPAALAADWEDYKKYCDTKMVLKTQFHSREGVFVTDAVPAAVTYEINGFCVWAKITKQSFYDTYQNDPKFSDLVKRMQEECEADVRYKLEQGIIPASLAGLWMGRHGYSLKQEEKVSITSTKEAAERIESIINEVKDDSGNTCNS